MTQAVDTPTDPGPGLVRSGLAVVALAFALLLIAGTVSFLIARSHQPGTPVFCKGVGLLLSGGVSGGSSPQAALELWLEADGAQPPAKDWQRHGTTFVNTTYDHGAHGYGYRSVTADRPSLTRNPPGGVLPPDHWYIDGACV